MASEVKTNKVSPSTGSTTEVTGLITSTSDARGDLLYHDGTNFTRLEKPGTPADELLTFATGASDPAWVAPAAGGVTQLSQWQLQADFVNTQTPVTNFLIADGDGYGTVGTAPTISTGVWTLSATGYYLITLQAEYYDSSHSNDYAIAIETCTDGGSFGTAATLRDKFLGSSGSFHVLFGNFVFNCTDTSTHLVRINCDVSASTISTRGSANENRTAVTFIRLA